VQSSSLGCSYLIGCKVQCSSVGSAQSCFRQARVLFYSRLGTPWRNLLLSGQVMKPGDLGCYKKMLECREKGYSGIGIFTVSQLCQSGIGIPASGSVRYRWSRISPALPSNDNRLMAYQGYQWFPFIALHADHVSQFHWNL
jgi:hypothetical protein